jgi:SAM-dependent methyltransferase
MLKDKFQLSRSLDAESKSRMSLNFAHWERRAAEHKSSYCASWEDRNAVLLEIETVGKYIETGMTVLDAGCANGFTTFEILSKCPRAVRAFDYSPSMIAAAQAEQPLRDPERRIRFGVGNVLEIPEESGQFDLAYTVRVLINLPNWETQKDAIREVHRVLRPGALYVLSEAFEGSQEKLNRLRQEAGLAPLAPPAFNLYLREEALENFVEPLFDLMEIARFSSLYYVASRFVRELAMRPGEAPSYHHPINRFFKDIPSTECSGDFGIQKAYVLKKR